MGNVGSMETRQGSGVLRGPPFLHITPLRGRTRSQKSLWERPLSRKRSEAVLDQGKSKANSHSPKPSPGRPLLIPFSERIIQHLSRPRPQRSHRLAAGYRISLSKLHLLKSLSGLKLAPLVPKSTLS